MLLFDKDFSIPQENNSSDDYGKYQHLFYVHSMYIFYVHDPTKYEDNKSKWLAKPCSLEE
jgi:hypothetical protein